MTQEDFRKLKRAMANGENIESIQWDEMEAPLEKFYIHLSKSEPITVKITKEG